MSARRVKRAAPDALPGRRAPERHQITWAARTRRPRGFGAALVRRTVEAALAIGGPRAPRGALSIVFVDDDELAGMHADWLDDPSPTDVITFDLGRDSQGPVGELYVSAERARAVATRRGLDPLRELLLYVAHGVLHLCGHDDHEAEQRRRMRGAERRVFARLATASPERASGKRRRAAGPRSSANPGARPPRGRARGA